MRDDASEGQETWAPAGEDTSQAPANSSEHLSAQPARDLSPLASRTVSEQFCCSTHPSPWYSVMAVLAKEYTFSCLVNIPGSFPL